MTRRLLPLDTGHADFAETDRETRIVAAALAGKNNTETAETVGMSVRGVQDALRRVRERARRYGYEPATGATAGQHNAVKGESILYAKETGADGETVDVERLRWVKTSRTAEEMIAGAREVAAGLIEAVPPVRPVRLAKATARAHDPHLLNAHVLTDTHLGMLAWAQETGGEDWDTARAEATILAWAHTGLAMAPAAETGLLLGLGDLLDTDGIAPVTPTSHHVLDVDSRFAKIVRTIIRALRQVIAAFLARYGRVHAVFAPGNHDTSSSIWLREAFAALYADEPRITVDLSPSPYGVLEHGDTSVWWHHGDKRGVKEVDRTLAGRFPGAFGRTRHRYCHIGHRHSRAVFESELMQVEQHGILPPANAHSANQGYVSQRAAEVVTYDDRYGEVGRFRMTPETLRAAA